MSTPILTTKLYSPPPRPKAVARPRLVERLNAGLHRKLTLISAPAGFGKTSLVTEWLTACDRPRAWLSLDEEDNDPIRFLTYLVAALQSVEASAGEGVMGLLGSPQPPPPESILTALLNDVTTIPVEFILVLDDYHVIDNPDVDNGLTFLLEYLPPQMHLVMTTREDPPFPLARLRARGLLTEVRATDLRFTLSETAGFLNQVMDLNLSADDITALEHRTEGWIAGLQLAAISLQGHPDINDFLQSFTGSHHFVLDYLVEEVLHQQSEQVQTFLLRTSILDRMCGPLCDAVLGDSSASGQGTLQLIEQANLFVIPLDNERRWYRYHHLFADLLRQRLERDNTPSDERVDVAELHIRASQWYEDNGLDLEAFHHATAAHDLARAERLIEGDGMPLHFRGGASPIRNWLKSLPRTVLNDYPSLWITYASVLLGSGQTEGVEDKLRAADFALQGAEQNDKNRDLIGRVAAVRSMLAASLRQVETIISESQRALEYLHPDNLAFRTSTLWKLGFAYQLQGKREAAIEAYTDVIAMGEASGNFVFTYLATIGLASVQETENQLYQSAETYQRVLELQEGKSPVDAYFAYLGLGRIYYQWNDLETARHYVEQSIERAREVENSDRSVGGMVLLARLELAEGDLDSASKMLDEATAFVRKHDFPNRLSEIATVQVLVSLHKGDVAEARYLAETHDLPMSQARVCLAQDDPAAAIAVLEPHYQQIDEQLKVLVLQSVAYHAHGETEQALQALGEALMLAEAGGFVRIFVDEGVPMAELLSEAIADGLMPDYARKLLSAFEDAQTTDGTLTAQPLVEPLSERELEILHLVAEGLSNREIGERLYLALSTVKGHNRNIYGKLQVQRRTEAVARARELGLI